MDIDTQTSGSDLSISTGIKTISYDVTGSNPSIFVSVITQTGENYQITTMTYGGESLTKVGQLEIAGVIHSFWYKTNCKSGTNDLVITFHPPISCTAYWCISSYTGTQNTVYDVLGTEGPNTSDSVSKSVTTTVDNVWLVGSSYCNNAITSSSNTIRVSSSGNIMSIIDTNGPVGAPGSYSLDATQTSSGSIGIIVLGIVPLYIPKIVIF